MTFISAKINSSKLVTRTWGSAPPPFDRVHCPLLDYIFYLFQRENCRRESNSQVEEAGIREPLLPQMYPGLLLHLLQQYKGELCISIIHALGPCRLSCPFPIPHHL